MAAARKKKPGEGADTIKSRDPATFRVSAESHQKHFKGAKDVLTEIVYKANKVREACDPPYQCHQPNEAR